MKDNDTFSFSTSLPLSCVTINPLHDSVNHDRGQHDIIPTTNKECDSDTKMNSDINHSFDVGTSSYKECVASMEATSPRPNIERKHPKRCANTYILVVRCGRRPVKLNIRSKKLLKQLHQAYKDKQSSCSLIVQHLQVGPLRTVPVGVPRYRASRFRLKLLVVNSKEFLEKRSKPTKKKNNNESKISAVKKLQHRFVEELEKAAAAPEKRIKCTKHFHQSKTKDVTCDEIDDIFSILDK